MTTDRVKQQQLSKIRDLLDKNKSTKEIAELLKIQPRTVDNRIKEIRKQDGTNWKEIAINDLQQRAINILESLEFCVSVNKDICTNSKDDKARIEASKMVVETNIALYQFIEHGPNALGARPKQDALVKKYKPEEVGLG